MGNTRDTGYLQNLVTYDASGNIVLPANLTVNGNLLVATQSYVTTQISNLINGAPALLDTLDELAAALGDDANFASTITTSIAGKQAQLNGTGFVKVTGTTVSYDNSTYLTTSSASSTYVPYSGALASVNLGVYSITANAINSAGSGSIAGQINLRSDAFFSLVNGYGSIASGTTNQFNLYQTTGAGVFRGAILSLNSITASATRTYTLPDATGTLALTSDIPSVAGSYLPLTGGTLTGTLSVTNNGQILIGTTNAPTPVVGVSFPFSVTSAAATRIRIDSTRGEPNYANAGVGLYANGVQKWSFAHYSTNSGVDYDFTIYNDALTSSAILVKGSNSNVGIGTTNPRTRLQVTPQSNAEVPVLGTATGVAIFTSTNTNYGLQFNSTSDGSFHIQSQRFDGSATAYNLILNYAGGNVAIGTQSAYGKLQITGAHTSGYGILNINSSNSCLISLDSSSTYDVRLRYKYQGTDQWFTGMYDDTSYKFINAPGTTILTLAQSGTATLTVNASSNITFAGAGTDASIIKAGSGDELYLGGNDTWQMRLSGGNILMDNGGNLGVGISSPFAKLHVRSSTNEGTIAIGHQSFPGLILSSAASGEFRIDNRSSFNGYITFYPNGQNTTLGSEAMRITSTGASYFTNKLTVGGSGSYTSATLASEGSLKVQRTIYSWYQGGSNAWDNYNYLHIKTNISSGLGGNIHYTMSLFTARLYSYTGTIREGQLGFHNWDGAFYAVAATGNIWSSPYRASDGFVVLVLTISSSSHTGVTIDWHQAFPYPFVDKVATAVSASNSTSGVY
jgi:hypothetical protein